MTTFIWFLIITFLYVLFGIWCYKITWPDVEENLDKKVKFSEFRRMYRVIIRIFFFMLWPVVFTVFIIVIIAAVVATITEITTEHLKSFYKDLIK